MLILTAKEPTVVGKQRMFIRIRPIVLTFFMIVGSFAPALFSRSRVSSYAPERVEFTARCHDDRLVEKETAQSRLSFFTGPGNGIVCWNMRES